MEIGLGVDTRFSLSESDQRVIAREARRLGFTSLWTPIGADRGPFDVCALWHEASGLATGIAVAPLSGWPLRDLATVANETFRRCDGAFTLGIGSGRTAENVIRVMRGAIRDLREALPDVPVFLGALGPQMLRLAGRRYDGAALNWCDTEQVRWSRGAIAAGAHAAGRDPNEVKVHEYVRVCVDDDVAAARTSFARMVMTYALAPRGADTTKGYRAHFGRMGFGDAIADLERRREADATEEDLAARFPDELLRRVGYWGTPAGARDAFRRLAGGLDIAVVRLVPASRNDLRAVRTAMEACAPSG